MSPLYATLHRWAATPFVWGETDCMLVLADWIETVHGTDPAAGLRYTYHDALTCQRAVRWFTDPVGAVERCLETIGGLPRTEAPEPGDMAVLALRGEDGRRMPTGALWLGRAWAIKGPEGTTTLAPRVAGAPLAIWSVGYAP